MQREGRSPPVFPNAGSPVLVAPAAAGLSATARAALLRLIAIPAVHGPVAAWLKRNRRLLPAPGAGDRGPSGFRPLVSAASPAPLFALPRRAAGLAALRGRIPALLEERLVFARECKLSPAVATGELQISSHGESSFPLYVIFPDSADSVNLGLLPSPPHAWKTVGNPAHPASASHLLSPTGIMSFSGVILRYGLPFQRCGFHRF